MRARVRRAAREERVARDGREARRRRRLPRLREDLAQQRQHVDEGVVMRVRERLEQVKSPLRDAVLVGPREGRQERRVAYRNRERGSSAARNLNLATDKKKVESVIPILTFSI